MFGRHRRGREAAAADAARESARGKLFEQLALRPETVCPFLGTAEERTGYQPEANPEHRCYASGEPTPLSDEQQSRICLQRGYSNCPRYLRGVLVIPSEELGALRRPAAAVPAAAPPRPAPTDRAPSRSPSTRTGPAGRDEERHRRWVPVAAALLIGLLLVGGAVAVFASRSPVAVFGSPTSTTSPTGRPGPTGAVTPVPTPAAGDVFDHYAVTVAAREYTIFHVGSDGGLTDGRVVLFSANSQGPAERLTAANGQRYWQLTDGFYSGYSYVAGRSGPFGVSKIFRRSDGRTSSERLPDSQL